MWISILSNVVSTYIYVHCMYMYVDFEIIKFRYFRYMCMYMYVDFDILTNSFLQRYVYAHVCGFRYYQMSLL